MKKTLFNIALFFKRPNFISRLILLGGSLLLLTFIFVPDLKFNLEMKHPKKMTIEEIQRTPNNLLPRYIILEDAQLLKVKTSLSQLQIDSLFAGKAKIDSNNIDVQQRSYNYVLEQKVSKNKRDTTISSISYPVYSNKEIQKNPNISTLDLTCYVVIKDSKITSKMLEGDKYFTDSTFAIQGEFNGLTIDNESLKLLQDNGYRVSKSAIILQKGSTPMSLKTSIILTILSSLFAFFCFLGFFPRGLLCKIFGVEEVANYKIWKS